MQKICRKCAKFYIFDHMRDKDFLKKCLFEIEEKLDWNDASQWKEPDFLKLAELISKESNISISPHTLKRLFGKIDYSKTYNPQKATKDALAKFLGYNDWENYCTANLNQPVEVEGEEPSFEPKKESKRKNIIVWVIVIFLVGLMSWFFFPKKEVVSRKDYSFDLKDSIGDVPFTVSLNYDIQELEMDSILIDFDFIHPEHGNQFFIPKRDHFINNFTYQIPGYYTIELMGDGELLSSKKVLATSDAWDSYFLLENDMDNFWFDTEIRRISEYEGRYMARDDLAAEGFDSNKVFYVRHRLFKKFDIDGDNFDLKTRFKSTENTGGISCYDFTINLTCSEANNFFRLMEDGCSRYSGLKIGEKSFTGIDQDLSRFKLDHTDWNELQVKVVNKYVEVFLNGELIYKGSYSKSNGELLGIESIFKGAGIWDYIRIEDLVSGNTFVDEFDSKE